MSVVVLTVMYCVWESLVLIDLTILLAREVLMESTRLRVSSPPRRTRVVGATVDKQSLILDR